MKFFDKAYSSMQDKGLFPHLRSRLFSNIIDCLILFILLIPVDNFAKKVIFAGVDLQSIDERIMSLEPNTAEFDAVIEERNAIIGPRTKEIIVWQIVLIGIMSFYFCFSWIYLGATPGKLMMGMKIVDEKTLQKPSNKQFYIRLVTGIFSSGLVMIGFLFCLFSKKKMALHDFSAGTVVVRTSALESGQQVKIA